MIRVIAEVSGGGGGGGRIPGNSHQGRGGPRDRERRPASRRSPERRALLEPCAHAGRGPRLPPVTQPSQQWAAREKERFLNRTEQEGHSMPAVLSHQ